MNPNNDCKFIGRLTKDPEVRQFQNGGSQVRFSVAVKRNFKNRDGNYEADFLDCQAANQLGDAIAKYFHKGSPIVLCGDLRNNNYTDRDGNKRFGFVVNVTDFAFPPVSSENNTAQQQTDAPTSTPVQQQMTAQASPTTPPGFDAIPSGADEFLPFA